MVIGIDLGTTNSLVAYYTEDGPKIIPNRYGKNLTPSVVSIDEEDQVYIGDAAVERNLLYPDSAVSVFKRDMGTKKKFRLGTKEFFPEEISSFVLRSLKEDAELYLGTEITEAVISVPAYFNDARRRATKRAGELAGLKVERIISEPTAAALAYGIADEDDEARYLVFDLGGGTFDVSILEIFENILEVTSVAGDNYLGGENFTDVIEKMFYKNFKDIDKDNLDEKTLRYVHSQAEKCKRSFNSNRESIMKCILDEKEYEFIVKYDEYEEACEDLLDRIKKTVQKSLSDANINIRDIDKVILVGGATKDFVVKNFVAKIFRLLPFTNINPDETVALGCAVQAAIKERNESLSEVILTDVCSFTLGTAVAENNIHGDMVYDVYMPIIERNTVIPVSRTKQVSTLYDNQESIKIAVLQGESLRASENLRLGEIIVDIPAKKAGEISVKITYTYDINSILEVEAEIVDTGKKVKSFFKGQDNDLTDEEIQERFETLSYLKIHPRDKEENKYLRLKGERLYQESMGNDRLRLKDAILTFEFALESYEKDKIRIAKKYLKQIIDEIENRDVW